MSPAEFSAIRLSLLVATVAVAVSLPAGIFFGWLLARKRFFGKSIVDTVVNLPLVLPPVVTGYLLLITFGKNGFIGDLLHRWTGWRFVFDWKGAALAAAIVSFPLMVRAIRVAMNSVDQGLEQAAATLGARPLDVFATVTLPGARRGIIAGCVLAFARSLGEFGATIMVAGNIAGESRTIPLYIYEQLQTPDGFRQSFPIIVVSVLLAAVALFVSELTNRRADIDPS